jgi:hypothetical protein
MILSFSLIALSAVLVALLIYLDSTHQTKGIAQRRRARIVPSGFVIKKVCFLDQFEEAPKYPRHPQEIADRKCYGRRRKYESGVGRGVFYLDYLNESLVPYETFLVPCLDAGQADLIVADSWGGRERFDHKTKPTLQGGWESWVQAEFEETGLT